MDKNNDAAQEALQQLAFDDRSNWAAMLESHNYRPSHAAQYVGLAESTLAKMRLRGDGPPYSKAGRSVIYRRSDLDRWLASLRRQNTSQRSPAPV